MKLKKHAVTIATLAVLLAAAVTAYAKIKPKNIDRSIRTHDIVIPAAISDETIGLTAGSVTVGASGVIAATQANAASLTILEAAIGAMRYPTRVRAGVLDDTTTDDTLGCTSVVIVGRDQFGNDVSETLSTVPDINSPEAPTENADLTSVLSVSVYEAVTSVVAAGCGIGTEANDVLFVGMTRYVGLQRDAGASSEVLSVCDATGEVCIKGTGIDVIDSGAFNFRRDWLSLILIEGQGSAPNAFPSLDGADTLILRVRSPLRN